MKFSNSFRILDAGRTNWTGRTLYTSSRTWWPMPTILTLGRMRQEDLQFEVSLIERANSHQPESLTGEKGAPGPQLGVEHLQGSKFDALDHKTVV